MEQLIDRFGVSEFAFADEQFLGHGTSSTNRAIAIADEILRRGLNCKWYMETRSSDVSLPLFRKLRESGLRAVFMGIESGFDPALKSLNKGIRASQHMKAIEVLKELEILPSIGFIMFRPETTIEVSVWFWPSMRSVGSRGRWPLWAHWFVSTKGNRGHIE